MASATQLKEYKLTDKDKAKALREAFRDVIAEDTAPIDNAMDRLIDILNWERIVNSDGVIVDFFDVNAYEHLRKRAATFFKHYKAATGDNFASKVKDALTTYSSANSPDGMPGGVEGAPPFDNGASDSALSAPQSEPGEAGSVDDDERMAREDFDLNAYDETYKALAEAFKQIKWREGSGKQQFAYIDARQVMNRLDRVLKPHNWQTRQTVVGAVVVVELGIRVPGSDEWVWKAGESGMQYASPDAKKTKRVKAGWNYQVPLRDENGYLTGAYVTRKATEDMIVEVPLDKDDYANAVKGAASDAFKRAAVAHLVGRFLYDMRK